MLDGLGKTVSRWKKSFHLKDILTIGKESFHDIPSIAKM